MKTFVKLNELSFIRKNQVTGEQICRGESELYRTADAFRVYLESSRRRDSIQNEFSGKDRTTEEAANIVGLTTPDRVIVMICFLTKSCEKK